METNKYTANQTLAALLEGKLYHLYGSVSGTSEAGTEGIDPLSLPYTNLIVDAYTVCPDLLSPEDHRFDVVAVRNPEAADMRSAFRAVAILRPEVYSLLFTWGETSPTMVFRKLVSYCTLTAEKRREICKQIRNVVMEREEEVVSFDESEFKAVYNMLAPTMAPQMRRAVQQVLSRYTGAFMSSQDKKRLDYVFNTCLGVRNIKRNSSEEMLRQFDALYFGRDTLKKQLIDFDCKKNSEMGAAHGYKYLFVGPPGAGKTYFAECIAKVLGRPLALISISACNSTLDLIGCHRSYSDAQPGRIANAFHQAGTTELVILLDEIDAASQVHNKDGSLTSALLDVLGNPLFTDICFDIPINVSNTIWLATANSTSGLTGEIVNRFDRVIEFPDYTDAEKMDYVKQRLITSDEFTSSAHTTYTWTDDGIHYLIDQCCADTGLREVRKKVNMANAEMLRQHPSDEVMIDRPFLTQFFEQTCTGPLDVIYRHRRSLPAGEWETARELYHQAHSKADEKQKADANRVLELLAALIPAEGNAVAFDTKTVALEDSFGRETESYLIGMEKTRHEMDCFLWSKRNKVSGDTPALLLIGPPGTGKTSLAREYAEQEHCKLVTVSMAGLKREDMAGTAREFKGSHPGLIVSSIASAMKTLKGGEGIMLLLDEIDKATTDVHDLLSSLLDDSGEVFFDAFLGIPVRLPVLGFICTANVYARIPDILRSRLFPIQVEGYSNKEKTDILLSGLIPRLELSYGGSHITMTHAAAALLAAASEEGGMRDVKHRLDLMVAELALEQKLVTPFTLTITEEDVRRLSAVSEDEACMPADPEVGCVFGLAVTSLGKGDLLPIRVVANPEGDGSVQVIGNAEPVVKESAIVGSEYLKAKNLVPAATSFKVFFPDLSVKKDGPSAGAAICAAMYGAAHKVATKRVAVTGEVAFDGSVSRVGGIHAKVSAAVEAGCSKVYVPAGTPAVDYDGYEAYVCPFASIEELLKTME